MADDSHNRAGAAPDPLNSDDLRKVELITRGVVKSMRPAGFRWNGEVSMGHVISAVAVIGAAITLYVNQARTDERQDAAIGDAARRVGVVEAAFETWRVQQNEMTRTLGVIDERTRNLVTSQERVERRLEGR